MRKNLVYRPRLSEILEARAVPATLGVVTPTGLVGISVTLPGQISTNSPQVKAAFAAFDQSYIKAVDTILMGQGTDGLVAPVRNQAAFDAAIEQSLSQLAEQLVLSLNPTTTTTTTGSTTSTGTTATGSTGTTSNGSTTSTAAGQVVNAIVGSGSNSLESQLLGRSTSDLLLAVPGLSTVTSLSTATPVPNVVSTAEQVRPTNRVPVVEGVGSSTADLVSTVSPSKASDDVRSAFGNFLNDYFKAVQGVLLAPGSNGQVNPQANRANFDAQVDQALRSLETRLSASLSRYPATSGLGPQIRSTIEGDGASSLKGQLANLATPGGSQALAVRDFTLGSTRAIAQVLSLISGDVSKLLGPAGQ